MLRSLSLASDIFDQLKLHKDATEAFTGLFNSLPGTKNEKIRLKALEEVGGIFSGETKLLGKIEFLLSKSLSIEGRNLDHI